jgi:Uma2 family endonuclease
MDVESKKYIFDDFLKFHEKLGERGGFEFSEGLIYDKYAGKPLDDSLVDYVLSDTYNENELPLFEMPTQEHDILISNLMRLLFRFLDENTDNIYSQKTTIKKFEGEKSFREPDILIVEADKEQRNIYHQIENPLVLIEVLSKSTQSVDLGEKILEYQQIASVQAYLIVWQNKPQIIAYNRLSEKTWVESIDIGLEQNLVINALHLSIPFKEIYKKIHF